MHLIIISRHLWHLLTTLQCVAAPWLGITVLEYFKIWRHTKTNSMAHQLRNTDTDNELARKQLNLIIFACNPKDVRF
jgi:hypothetical protein